MSDDGKPVPPEMLERAAAALGDDLDPAWEAMMDRPATRGELLQLAGQLQLGIMSQTLFGVSLIDGDEALQREMGEKTVDHALKISKTMRTLVDQWKKEL